MASGPRSKVINEDEVGTYHCFNRCVRHAYLMGEDFATKRNYNHRKNWFRSLLENLASQFAIDMAKYALLDNHFHLLVRNRPDLAAQWTGEEILRRAMTIWPSSFRRDKTFVQPHEPLPEMLLKNKKLIKKMRRRLSSISWLMKTVCERIARRANLEDGVTGVFWDGRFRCERLLDDAAVLACSVYIDLNLVRAGRHRTPESSRFTSAYDRIRGLRARMRRRQQEGIAQDGFLCPLNALGDYPNEELAKAGKRASDKGLLEMPLPVYLHILDRTGRELRRDKRGAIPASLAPILERLGIAADKWLQCVSTYAQWARKVVGSVEHMRIAAKRADRHWNHGISRAKEFFTTAPRAAG